MASLLTALFFQRPQQIALAQQTPSPTNGAICVLAYDDINRNGYRDPGEPLLANVNASLMLNGSVTIENHITDALKPYCFDNLPPQQYTLRFSSPLLQPTTLTTFTFALGPGETVQQEFGAVTVSSDNALTADSANGGSTWTIPQRLALSALGSFLTMTFLGGFGLILYGLVGKRSRRNNPYESR